MSDHLSPDPALASLQLGSLVKHLEARVAALEARPAAAVPSGPVEDPAPSPRLCWCGHALYQHDIANLTCQRCNTVHEFVEPGLGGEQVAHNPVGEPGNEPGIEMCERCRHLMDSHDQGTGACDLCGYCDEAAYATKHYRRSGYTSRGRVIDAAPAVSIPPTGSPLIPLAALLENLRAMESQPSCTDGSWGPSEDYLSAIQEVSRDAERLAALGWTTSNIPAPSPVVEQPEPAGQSVPLSDLWLEVPAPVAWRHQTTSGGTAWDGWAATAVPNVAQVWRDQGFAVEPLYLAAPVLPPLPDGTGPEWDALLSAARWVISAHTNVDPTMSRQEAEWEAIGGLTAAVGKFPEERAAAVVTLPAGDDPT